MPLVGVLVGSVVLLGVFPASPARGLPAPTGKSVRVAVLATATPAAAKARTARLLAARIQSKALGRSVSVVVRNVVGGAPIWAIRDTTPMLPASTMKLVTATTALTVMGGARLLPTAVVAGAQAHDVVLVAGGDPLLTSRTLLSLAAATAAHLIRALPASVTIPPAVPTKRTPLAFSVHVDDSLFAAPSAGPGWTPGYVPSVVRPVRALVRDGRVLTDTSADAGRYLALQVNLALRAQLGASRPDLAVSASYSGPEIAPASSTVLARYRGHSVSTALSRMLLVSDNNIAEMMYRLSARAAGRAGTWAGGRATALGTLARLHIRTAGLALFDGSGVSRRDRLTTYALVQLLQLAQSPRYPQLASLRSMLPVAGVSGTLKASNRRFVSGPSKCARGKIQAKTGTLHDVVGLAGYTRGADGFLRAFAILVNARPERTYPTLATRQAVDVLAATINGCY